jgi:hypothetical protein
MSGSYRLTAPARNAYQPSGLETALGQALMSKLSGPQAAGYFMGAQGQSMAANRQYNEQLADYNLMAQEQAKVANALKAQELQYDLTGKFAANPGSVSLLAPQLIAPGQEGLAARYTLADVANTEAQAAERHAGGVRSLSDAGWSPGAIGNNNAGTGGYSFIGRPDIGIANINQSGQNARHTSISGDAQLRADTDSATTRLAARQSEGAAKAGEAAYLAAKKAAEAQFRASIPGLSAGIMPPDIAAQIEQRAVEARNAAVERFAATGYTLNPNGSTTPVVPVDRNRLNNQSAAQMRREAMDTLTGDALAARLAEISRIHAGATQQRTTISPPTVQPPPQAQGAGSNAAPSPATGVGDGSGEVTPPVSQQRYVIRYKDGPINGKQMRKTWYSDGSVTTQEL